MTKQEKKKEVIKYSKHDANRPKDELMRIMHELEEIGAKREARGLETIILKLEHWQNR